MGGATFVAIFLIFQFLIFLSGIHGRKRSMPSGSTKESSMTCLSSVRTTAFSRSVPQPSGGCSRAVPRISPISYLEKKAGEIQLKPNIKYINPLKATVAGAYEESAVEMKLDTMTMKQVTDFLYVVEAPKDLVKVSKISISKMKKDRNI